MNSKKIKPQFIKKTNPRVGLIVLATDVMIEKDFLKVFNGVHADLFVNRITNYNPVTADNLKKMENKITSVTENILPGEKIDCIVYGCTSGTIVSGYDNIKKKINTAKPDALVTAPSTAALNALKRKNISKISIVTPYIKSVNDDVVNFFKNNNFEITSNTYFDIESDVDIGKVDQDQLFEILSKIDHKNAEALFVSCTSLPVLSIIEKLEKKLNMTVLSSNQALIWETLESINRNNSIKGYGSLFS
ncbi:racemase [Candidatus Pelagibacter sp.]|nr:racemase [Candidatus Pelagibacter sp.]